MSLSIYFPVDPNPPELLTVDDNSLEQFLLSYLSAQGIQIILSSNETMQPKKDHRKKLSKEEKHRVKAEKKAAKAEAKRLKKENKSEKRKNNRKGERK